MNTRFCRSPGAQENAPWDCTRWSLTRGKLRRGRMVAHHPYSKGALALAATIGSSHGWVRRHLERRRVHPSQRTRSSESGCPIAASLSGVPSGVPVTAFDAAARVQPMVAPVRIIAPYPPAFEGPSALCARSFPLEAPARRALSCGGPGAASADGKSIASESCQIGQIDARMAASMAQGMVLNGVATRGGPFPLCARGWMPGGTRHRRALSVLFHQLASSTPCAAISSTSRRIEIARPSARNSSARRYILLALTQRPKGCSRLRTSIVVVTPTAETTRPPARAIRRASSPSRGAPRMAIRSPFSDPSRVGFGAGLRRFGGGLNHPGRSMPV
jgi:hypothetical protein